MENPGTACFCMERHIIVTDLNYGKIFNSFSNNTKFLIIGDINQLDHYSDKLGGSATIRGWEDIMEWKINLQLQDVPYSGPRYTSSNGSEGDELIMERLDRGYATLEWMSAFPQTQIQNLPILQSDHGAILLTLSSEMRKQHRLYQIENWCLQQPEVKNMVVYFWQCRPILFVVDSMPLGGNLKNGAFIGNSSGVSIGRLSSSG